jgi:hypothetical protein
MSVSYKKLANDVIAVTYDLQQDKDWGTPRLSRIFNFTAQQVVTLYERGGAEEYTIPKGSEYGSSSKGRSVAVTSAMQVQNFDELPNQDDIVHMHAELKKRGGKPPSLENILGRLNKLKPGLKS